ncbi:LysR substrate-binding domain-containing protein [Pelomonas sp. SE-A7]|uniref:LysR family transcriptional regulator n=1 Tax=Pelomonas sp. SE-A7 TaxID=3054953 RepID=UPI00259C93C1|nr:LysR substrate-binding domain-containing protein [Pelomonas sp. SE-A7]MDM4768137.1 LysR substrate-binding domain-containing protein [Pelomonas sp. SE-A7]
MQRPSAETISPDEVENFIRRRLSLRHLRMLLALNATGTISAAAESLHVTQPAVSKALAEIEGGVGQALFARRGRSLRPTAMGQRLVDLALKLDADLRRGAGDLGSMARGASGELLVGSTNAALAKILPEAIVAMKAEHPSVTISVRTHALSSLFAELREGRLDLVIARVPPQELPADLESSRLIEQTQVLTISSIHPLAKAGPVGWETLTRQAWIWELPGTRSRALQDRMWQGLGLPLPTNVIETGDLMLALSLMKRMPLLMVMPQHVARVAAQTGVLNILPLAMDSGLSDLTAWHLREPQGELVLRFKQLLLEAAQASV